MKTKKMIETKENLYNLLTNYLFCKTCDAFLSVRCGNFDADNFNLVVFLLKNFETNKNEPNTLNKYKMYLSYLLNLLSKYLKAKSQEDLKCIVGFLFDSQAGRIMPLDILFRFREIIFKLTKFSIHSNQLSNELIDIIREFFAAQNFFLSNSDEPQVSDDTPSDLDEIYTEICNLIKSEIYVTNNSVLLELVKKIDYSKETMDELEQSFHILNKFNLFKKKKSHEFDASIENEENDSTRKNVSSICIKKLNISTNEQQQKAQGFAESAQIELLREIQNSDQPTLNLINETDEAAHTETLMNTEHVEINLEARVVRSTHKSPKKKPHRETLPQSSVYSTEESSEEIKKINSPSKNVRAENKINGKKTNDAENKKQATTTNSAQKIIFSDEESNEKQVCKANSPSKNNRSAKITKELSDVEEDVEMTVAVEEKASVKNKKAKNCVLSQSSIYTAEMSSDERVSKMSTPLKSPTKTVRIAKKIVELSDKNAGDDEEAKTSTASTDQASLKKKKNKSSNRPTLPRASKLKAIKDLSSSMLDTDGLSQDDSSDKDAELGDEDDDEEEEESTDIDEFDFDAYSSPIKKKPKNSLRTNKTQNLIDSTKTNYKRVINSVNSSDSEMTNVEVNTAKTDEQGKVSSKVAEESSDSELDESMRCNGPAAKKRAVSVAKPARVRNFWTDDETNYLVAGTITYGRGNWSVILKEFESKFNNRTNVMLKDRYRLIEKNGDLNRYLKTAQILNKKLKVDKEKENKK